MSKETKPSGIGLLTMGLFMAIVCFHEAIVDPTSTDRLTDFGFETRANMAIGCVLGIWLVIHAFRKK